MLTGCTNIFRLPSVPLSSPCEVAQAKSTDLNGDWLFRIDPDDIGISEHWHSSTTSENEWFSLEPGTPWEASGLEYDGVAWYRTRITIPEWSSVFLGFGRIDDAAMLWINGNRVGTWEDLLEQAVLIDILEYGKSGEELQLAWRISDQGGYGGIKQPVRIGSNPRTVMTGAQHVEWMARQNPEWPMPAWAKGQPFGWTMTGNMDTADEALVSSDGAVAPWARAPRVEIWIYDNDTGTIASADPTKVQFSLVNGRLPMPQWQWDALNINIENTMFGDSKHSAIRWKVTLKNTDSGSRHLTMLLSIRPFAINQNITPICSIRARRHSQLWINDLPFMIAATPASDTGAGLLQESMAKALVGEVPFNDSVRHLETADGVAFWAYPIDLNPSESAQFHFAFPATPGNKFPPVDNPIDEHIKETVKLWQNATTKVKMTIPDKALEAGVNASLGYLLLSLDPDGPHPGPLAHDAVWVRDAAYSGLALLQFGHTESVRNTVTATLATQETDGRVPPIRGKNVPWYDDEWDSQGQVIFLASTYYRFSGDKIQLRDWYPHLRKTAYYIADLRTRPSTVVRTAHGLLPPSKSAEDLGPPDWHHYWDNFWGVSGLQHAAYIASELGEINDSNWMQSEANALRESILDSVTAVMGPEPAFISGAVENSTDSAMARGSVPAIWPTEVFPLDMPLLTRSFDTYYRLWLEPNDGGFRHLGGHFWPYGGLDLAHAYLRLGRNDVLHQILGWTMRHETIPGTFAWAEQINPTNGSFSGGDMPHAWASSNFITLVREMLFSERGEALKLLSGVPDWWLTDGRTIQLESMPTYFGNFNLHTENTITQSDSGWNGDLIITLSGAAPPDGFRWKFPVTPTKLSGPPGTKVADGWLIVPPEAGVVKLTFTSQ